MANSNNNLSDLITRLSRNTVDGLSISKLLSPTQLIDKTPDTSKLPKIGNPGDIKASSMGAKDIPSSIQFGRPSSTRTSTSSSGSGWTNLLKQTASGGIASALGGGLGSIGGVGVLVSGILNLFGGGSSKNTPPPLVEFQLPASQEQTAYLSSKGNTVYHGSAEESSIRPTAGTSIYAGPNAGSPSYGAQNPQYRNADVVQAVKNALLNSSSLNDVIAEI